MRYVELARGRDYSGCGVKAYRGRPLAIADKKAAELVEGGFFRYSDAKTVPAKGRKPQKEARPDDEAAPDFGEGDV